MFVDLSTLFGTLHCIIHSEAWFRNFVATDIYMWNKLLKSSYVFKGVMGHIRNAQQICDQGLLGMCFPFWKNIFEEWQCINKFCHTLSYLKGLRRLHLIRIIIKLLMCKWFILSQLHLHYVQKELSFLFLALSHLTNFCSSSFISTASTGFPIWYNFPLLAVSRVTLDAPALTSFVGTM